MSNTNSQSVKAQIIDNVLVAMTYYLSSDVLEMLERVLTRNLVDVVVERINTLPMEMKDSIDNQNGYILQLFLYKKKKLADGTKYGYISAVKRLVTLVYKPLTNMEESDIYYYLDWYENRNVPLNGRKKPGPDHQQRAPFPVSLFHLDAKGKTDWKQSGGGNRAAEGSEETD